jgi:hypothetical protein
MKKSVLCQKDVKFTCPCGYCLECLMWKTHKGCVEEFKNKLEEEKENEKRAKRKNN